MALKFSFETIGSFVLSVSKFTLSAVKGKNNAMFSLVFVKCILTCIICFYSWQHDAELSNNKTIYYIEKPFARAVRQNDTSLQEKTCFLRIVDIRGKKKASITNIVNIPNRSTVFYEHHHKISTKSIRVCT